MDSETKPKVLIVYFTLTKQSGRVADAMAAEVTARGYDVTKATASAHLRKLLDASRSRRSHQFSRHSCATRPVRSGFHPRPSPATMT